MKFEYETKEDSRECVAYIQRGESGWECLTFKCNEVDAVDIFSDWSISQSAMWEPDSEHTVHKFYPGDKITITL